MTARARHVAVTVAVAALVGAAGAAPAEYDLDPQQTFVHFEVRHFDTSTLRGRVGPVRGEVMLDVAAPMISKAQTVNLRFQSTWPAKDIFHEYASDFAKKVNDMAGGRLKIEVLPSGSVVPAFQLLDAVNKGTLDGGHGVVAYHYGKKRAGAVGLGPGLSAWTRTWCWPGTTTAAARPCWTRSTRA
jgi:TRAP-type C4-dicarboxylate transport system substrate-binding protein